MPIILFEKLPFRGIFHSYSHTPTVFLNVYSRRFFRDSFRSFPGFFFLGGSAWISVGVPSGFAIPEFLLQEFLVGV